MHSIRNFVVVVVAVPAVSLSPPEVSRASKPVVVDASDAVVGADVCGVSTDIVISGTVTIHDQQDLITSTGPGSNDLFIGIVKQQLVLTYTSQVNGYTLTETYHLSVNDVVISDLGDGVWSATVSINGVALRLRDGNNTLIQDTGRIVLTDTFYLGNTATDLDDYFVSRTVESIAGPHPGFDDSVYCDAYVSVMS